MLPIITKSKDNPSTGNEVINNSLQYNFVVKPTFSVAAVRKNSPGVKAGLLKDERLISINGKKTADMTLQKIIEMIKSDEGKIISMIIERENKEIAVRFTLKDPIPYQE